MSVKAGASAYAKLTRNTYRTEPQFTHINISIIQEATITNINIFQMITAIHRRDSAVLRQSWSCISELV